MTYPLEGLKILDFSRVVAGPFAGRLLSDLGADVVKVEPPDGDVTRYWGREIANLTGYFFYQNAGKRNVCIDLRAEGSVELVKALVKEADIVIENYRPDVMPRLGIGYDDLKQINPKLIMLSISGFGHNGPESQRATYAPIVHAEAGLMHRMSSRSGLPLHGLPTSLADTNASLHGLIGVLSAVIMRDRTGLGQHIDIAMIDATVATDDQLHFDIDDSVGTGPVGDEIWKLPFGNILLSTDFRLLFRLLVSEMGVLDPSIPGMSLEEKISARRAAVADYANTLDTPEKCDAVFKQLNIAWGIIREPGNVEEQITLKARGAIVQVDDRAGGTRPVTQSPYRFSNAQSGVRGPAPHRGEHNSEVLDQWLGQSSQAIAALADSGVLIYDADWKHS